MSKIPDFTDSERWTVETAVKERYGKPVEVHVADAELRMYPDDRELTLCPTLFWEERGAGFVISKMGDNRFRTQFFYSKRDQYGTGREEYDDLLQCVTTVLRVQADHEQERAGIASGKTGADIKQ
jgi:hypothetical protein